MTPIDYKKLWKIAYRAWRIWMRDDHRYGEFGRWARSPLLSKFYIAAQQVTRDRKSKHEKLIEEMRSRTPRLMDKLIERLSVCAPQ